MAVTVSGTQITFNDATTQSTAATSGFSAMQVYTSGTNTWTIPSGVTRCKVTVVGAGGGGIGSDGQPCVTYTNGSSGGTSSFGAYCSATGGAGAVTSVSFFAAQGGTGSGGDLNLTGQTSANSGPRGNSYFGRAGMVTNASTVNSPTYGGGGSSAIVGGGGAGGVAIKYITGLTPGGTVTVTVGAGGAGGSNTWPGQAGAAGLVFIEY